METDAIKPSNSIKFKFVNITAGCVISVYAGKEIQKEALVKDTSATYNSHYLRCTPLK